MKYTIKKSELTRYIHESVTAALEGYDSGDLAMHQSANSDAELKKMDQYVEALRALSITLHRKQDPNSMNILKSINASLGPFVNKVTGAVKAGKLEEQPLAESFRKTKVAPKP